MTTKMIENSFSDLWEYISKYNLEKIHQNSEIKINIKKFHKNSYPLLIWRLIINEKFNSESDKDFVNYFSESVSDICSSLLLYSQGMYKSSRLSLRSAIENAIKSFGLIAGQKSLSFTSVRQLIEVVGDCELITKSQDTVSEYNKLRSSYSSLCEYVHTASIKQMSLIEALNEIPCHIPEDSNLILKDLCKVSSAINIIITIALKNHFDKSHYTYKDSILSGMPFSKRKSIMS